MPKKTDSRVIKNAYSTVIMTYSGVSYNLQN
jgi:hypothetical protein